MRMYTSDQGKYIKNKHDYGQFLNIDNGVNANIYEEK